MPIFRLLQNKAFEPEVVAAMVAAYDAVLDALRLHDRTDPLTEIIARRIIDHATAGERDPVRLRDGVLADLGHPPGSPDQE